MTLFWLLIILLGGGVAAAAGARRDTALPRWIALGAVSADFALALSLWGRHARAMALAGSGPWLEELDWAWVPPFGVHFHLALDGLSLLLLLLTFFLGILSILASWDEITANVGFFHLNLLWILAGITGVFLAVDLFLFYFAWEMMLIPMYLLIALWGHERRAYAAMKFFLFTQASGLLMLVAILALVFLHRQATGTLTFEYRQLLDTPLSENAGRWIMLGFFAAFAVKLPLFPLHTWLPDAHTEAPTAGSVILAGLLLKTGGYGMIRFVVPLFPGPARELAPAAMALGAIGIVYGAVLALAQSDLKRLIAYTSVSHLGFVVLGVFSWNEIALQGAVLTMLCHGISTGALFILAGALQGRLHTRDLGLMGGLWAVAPRLGGAGLVFALASLGLPGLGDFIGEFLVLLGTWGEHPVLALAGAVGILAATFYALQMVQRAFHGANTRNWSIPDLGARELAMVAVMAGSLLWLGLHPQPVLDTFHPALGRLLTAASGRP